MVKNILLLIAVWTVAPCQSSHYDVYKVSNPSDLTSMEFLSRLMNGSAQENLSIEENHMNGRSWPPAKKYGWNSFNSWNDTISWMVSLISKYPDIVRAEIGGSSFEERKIFGLKISYKTGNRGILIEAGMNGDEWITSAAATYIIDQLVNPPNENVRTLAESFDWYIFPHLNPDGYICSTQSKYKRHWRKNLSVSGRERCEGVNLNHNWGFHWGEIVTEDEKSPCDEAYPGPHAFSEPETRSFSEYLTQMKNHIQFYISLHSFGQLILYPYGYTSDPPQNIGNYRLLVDAAQKGFASRYGTEYRGGSIFNESYPISGCSIDWVQGTKVCGFAFQLNLRTPVHIEGGHTTRENEILPICEETMDGVASMINEAKKLGYFSFRFNG